MKKSNLFLTMLLGALMLCAMLPMTAPAEDAIGLETSELRIASVDDSAPGDLEIASDGEAPELDGIGELGVDLALDDGLEGSIPEAKDAQAESNSFIDGNYDHDAFDIDDSGVLVGYDGAGGKVVIPNGVKAIEECVFYDCDTITSVVIPEGVVKIGAMAFSYCDDLITVSVPSSVNSIGTSAFAYCPSLKAVIVSQGNYFYCSSNGILFDKSMKRLVCCPGSVVRYTIPKGVTSIGKSAFAGCTDLVYIKIPKGVTSIGENAFCQCSSLKNVMIPHGVTRIGKTAFSDCTALVRVDVPYSVSSIEDECFSGCSSLTSMNVWGDVSIPSSVTNIGKGAFINCTSMGSVTIPRSVNIINAFSFLGCKKLTYACIPSRVNYIGYHAFAYCSALKSVLVFARVINMDDDSFEGCSRKMAVFAYAGSNAFNWFKNHNYAVKPIPDYFLLLKGNTTQKVQVGDKVQIALDGAKSASYASSNNKIVAVSRNGTLTVKKAGTVMITVKMTFGGNWVLTLNVVNAPSLNRSSLSLLSGKSFQLKVNGLLSGRKVTWSSGNKEIATVEGGKVTAKKPGKCTIVAQVKNGVMLNCTVKVTSNDYIREREGTASGHSR